MSPTPKRRPDRLPAWLLTRPVASYSRTTDGKGKPIADRVMVSLTVPERAGIDRIIAAARAHKVPLTAPEIVRTAVDRLLADFEAAQLDADPAAGS